MKSIPFLWTLSFNWPIFRILLSLNSSFSSPLIKELGSHIKNLSTSCQRRQMCFFKISQGNAFLKNFHWKILNSNWLVFHSSAWYTSFLEFQLVYEFITYFNLFDSITNCSSSSFVNARKSLRLSFIYQPNLTFSFDPHWEISPWLQFNQEFELHLCFSELVSKDSSMVMKNIPFLWTLSSNWPIFRILLSLNSSFSLLLIKELDWHIKNLSTSCQRRRSDFFQEFSRKCIFKKLCLKKYSTPTGLYFMLQPEILHILSLI